ncbi:MAG: DUF1257 domain-containing protein [Tildeniella nuda ZEHNDER 1965/U140]|jgi:hypothetical protein|nr:DUF1257 domain-containing protein [Tildeniella nuda ZEHNDER 1965/U140]
MSHFTAIKTQIKDAEALVKALADVGFKQVEVHETAQPLYGFQGDLRSQTAEIIIRRKYVGGASNDIGFQRQQDGTFEAIISEYDRRKYAQPWLNQVMQRYGYHALMATAPAQGFTVEEEEVLADGTIRVVVGRWI